jgi:NitT/TauT family transport system ATP-binding protein
MSRVSVVRVGPRGQQFHLRNSVARQSVDVRQADAAEAAREAGVSVSRDRGNRPAIPAQAAIELREVTKRFRTPSRTFYTAVHDLSLTVEHGEFCAIVGPTGSGKSTTLSLVAGLEMPSRGQVLVLGEQVTGVSRRCGYMFQTDAVFPWKNVLENVATGPLYRSFDRQQARRQARDWIARVGLAGFEDRYPNQLSGGMRKRVALAQSLINEPEILLMDEPFAALDVQTRTLMENELLDLWSQTSASVVFVTHDLEEAISLADRVLVFTAAPATLKRSYQIGLPRPRNVTEIRFDPRFARIYEQIWEDLRSEVVVAYERSLKGTA